MLIALVPLFFFGYIGISQGKQMIKDKAASYLMNLSKRNAASVRQFMIERVNDMNLLSSLLDISDSNFEHQLMQVKNDPHRPYIDFFILSQSGTLIFSTGQKKIDSEILENANTLSLSWKGVRIQKIFNASHGDSINPVLILSKRLANQSNPDPQYLFTLIDFRFIDGLLRENNIEDTGEVYLVNQEGWFLSSSRFGAKVLQTKISIQESRSGNTLSARQSIDYRGKTVLQSRQNILPFNWVIVADQDMVEILDRIKELEKKAMVYASITGCIVFLLAFFISG